jgi:hypothetical protein
MQNPFFFFGHALMILITKAKIEVQINSKKDAKNIIQKQEKESFYLTNLQIRMLCLVGKKSEEKNREQKLLNLKNKKKSPFSSDKKSPSL